MQSFQPVLRLRQEPAIGWKKVMLSVSADT
jgi:hypothetical protein